MWKYQLLNDRERLTKLCSSTRTTTAYKMLPTEHGYLAIVTNLGQSRDVSCSQSPFFTFYHCYMLSAVTQILYNGTSGV